MELMEQQPALFEEERKLLASSNTAPAAITIGDSITAFGYDPDGWVTLLKQLYPEVLFVVSSPTCAAVGSTSHMSPSTAVVTYSAWRQCCWHQQQQASHARLLF
jgi:hypothetical protein